MQLAADLKKFVRHIRIIKPPNHKDMRRWLHAGATAEKVLCLVDNARFI
jgi:hypothetical protein